MSLKSLFVKDDSSDIVEEKKSTSPVKQSYSSPSSVSSLSASPSQFSTPTVSSAEKNEFMEFLNEVYQKGNFPGPDYQEFTDAIKAMETTPIDLKTKFITAFTVFKIQGVSKERLLDTAQKYITLISNQSTDFSKEIDNLLSTEVGTKQKKVTQFLQENAEIEKQMIALTEKRNKNNEIISATTNEINEQTSSLNIKKASFAAAANEFVAQVQKNIENINLYL